MSRVAPERPLRVVVAGAAGRLGSIAVHAVEAAEDLVLVGLLVRGDVPRADLAEGGADVLLDVSLAEATRVHAPMAARAGVCPVIGTSGLVEADIVALREACRAGGVAGLLVPNFSIGAVLQMRFAREAARWLPCTGLHEVHHAGKRDSPSGTARATADAIAAAAGGAPPITSERREEALAEQRVRFAGPFETLTLEHVVNDRAAYLPGLLLALRSVQRLPVGLSVGLDAVLDASL